MSPTPTAALTPEELAAKLDALDDETMCFDGPATYALIREAAGMIRTLASDNEQLNASFDLRHKADARAIKQWQEVTGRTMSMPDQADLCVFLLMALDMSEARATTAEAALSASLERERVVREALETVVIATDEVTRAKGRSASARGASDQKRRNMEEWVLRTTVALENALMFARAALQPQETADER